MLDMGIRLCYTYTMMTERHDKEKIMDLRQYTNHSDERAYYKNIPIANLEQVRRDLKASLLFPGERLVIRYRGPRNHRLDRRPRSRRMQDCAKAYATRFSVYVNEGSR